MRFAVLLTLIGGALLSGCSGSTAPEDLLAEANGSNVQRLANMYAIFQSRNEWRGPTDEAELKDFISSFPAEKLKSYGIDPSNPEAIFISDRDGQPFQIRYGIPGYIYGSKSPVVFENTGIDGKKMVGFLNSEKREVDQAEFDRLWSGQEDQDVTS